MRALLMHRDRDFDLEAALPRQAPALTQDLELERILGVMAQGDAFLFDVARKALLSSLTDVEAIRYRQAALQDCVEHEAVVRRIYDLTIETMETERKSYWGFFGRSPGSILFSGVSSLEVHVEALRRLRGIADECGDAFQSEAFRTLFAMLRHELDDDYIRRMQDHLKRLKFRDGVLISAALGAGNRGRNYVLRKPPAEPDGWLERIFAPKAPSFTFHLHPRDESGSRALAALRDRGINLVANAVGQSTDHVRSLFTMIKVELAFYIGCLNLRHRLTEKGEPVCIPSVLPAGDGRRSCRGLYDVSLSLGVEGRVVGNDLDAGDRDLVMITGANRGGKSTFLRSIGQALLMMQCGMFVGAESFTSRVCNGLFTHFKRDEDVAMKSGKFDEELGRMSEIAGAVTRGSLVLFNESFAATNEREGSEIGRQIVSALVEKGIGVFFVTHLYELAHGFYRRQRSDALFLRAERGEDGARPFALRVAEPLDTSYGADLYRKIFSGDPPLRAESTSQEPFCVHRGHAFPITSTGQGA